MAGLVWFGLVWIGLDHQQDNCGGCGVTCPQIGNGASCVNGVCQLQCAAGTADCNLDITDGCETNTSSSITSCGSCGYSCLTLGIAQPQCIGGVCQGACGSGFLNCDGYAWNERARDWRRVDLIRSLAHSDGWLIMWETETQPTDARRQCRAIRLTVADATSRARLSMSPRQCV